MRKYKVADLVYCRSSDTVLQIEKIIPDRYYVSKMIYRPNGENNTPTEYIVSEEELDKGKKVDQEFLKEFLTTPRAKVDLKVIRTMQSCSTPVIELEFLVKFKSDSWGVDGVYDVVFTDEDHKTLLTLLEKYNSWEIDREYQKEKYFPEGIKVIGQNYIVLTKDDKVEYYSNYKDIPFDNVKILKVNDSTITIRK